MTCTSPLMILHARAEARAILFRAGDYPCLREATAPLIKYAHDSGIVAQIGIDAVRNIIAADFDIQTRNEET